MIVGSHLDCVPDGGWLDGCLGVLAGAEMLAPRRAAGVATLARAGGLGRRGGRALRALAAGLPRRVRAARRARRRRGLDGGCRRRWRRTASVARPCRSAARAAGRRGGLRRAAHRAGPGARRERHAAGAAVDGCLGVRRTAFAFTGRAGHAGATPMDRCGGPAAGRGGVRARRPRRRGGGGRPGDGRHAAHRARRRRRRSRPACGSRSTCATRELDAPRGIPRARAGAMRGGGRRGAARSRRSEVWSIDPVRFDADAGGAGARARRAGEPLDLRARCTTPPRSRAPASRP